MREYALYRGDDILSLGTIDEIAEDLQVKVSTIKYYGTDAYKRKLKKRNAKKFRELVLLDDETQECPLCGRELNQNEMCVHNFD